jgi:hypothetical protein
MLISGDIPQVSQEAGVEIITKKGKAVAVDHFLFDSLWNQGHRRMPPQIDFKPEN